LERLRLAKDGVAHAAPVPRTQSFPDALNLAPRRKSLFSAADGVLQQTLTPVRKRLRRSSTATSTPANADNAAWFASLPPAIRRKHFSQEEQILFANERHSVILDAADELFHRRCLQESPLDPPPSLLASRPQTSYFPDYADGISFLDDTDSEPDEALEKTQEKTEDMANYSLDNFTWPEDEADLDLRLDDYHTAVVETAQHHAAPGRRRSFRRNLSLSTLPLRRSTIVSSTSNLHDSFNRARTAPLQPMASLLPRTQPTRHQSKASISSIDPQATHYQDPAARMKLRVYLASPSKFDEAVEFGFPSIQDKGRLHSEHDRPKTSPRLTNDSGRTFFTDDTPSLVGDDGSCPDEVDAIVDPRTPEDAEFRINGNPRQMSSDRQLVKPHVVRNLTEQYAQSTTLDREMTIHMTLTRPDLRTHEESRSPHVNLLPLEQSALPIVDNRQSIWDTLPEDESRVKKFWRKLKMR
jgi:hypothetical protein